jgi:hypothetical protein
MDFSRPHPSRGQYIIAAAMYVHDMSIAANIAEMRLAEARRKARRRSGFSLPLPPNPFSKGKVTVNVTEIHQDPLPSPHPQPAPTPLPLEDACSSEKNWNLRLSDMREIADQIGWGLRDNGKPYKKHSLTWLETNQRIISLGFKYFTNFNPRHFGGADWEGQVNRRWYHLNVTYPGGLDVQHGVPLGIDIHCEQYYERPSSIRHFFRFFGI